MERKTRLQLLTMCLLFAAVRGLMLLWEWSDNPFTRLPIEDAAAAWDAGGRMADGELVATTPFMAAPLYLWLLGVIRWLGLGLPALFGMQTLLWSATGYFLADAAYRFFVRTLPTVSAAKAALLAAAFFLWLPEPWMSTGRVLNSSLQLLLAVLLWRQLGLSLRPLRLGLLLGLNALVNPPFMLAVVLVPLWIRRRAGVAVLMVATLCIAPATIHNYLACGEFIPISAQAGLTFAHGNGPGADGLYHPVAGVSSERQRQNTDAFEIATKATGESSWAGTSRHFMQQGFEWWLSAPGAAVGAIGSKVMHFFTEYGYGDIYQTRLEREAGLAGHPGPSLFGGLFLAPALIATLLLFRRRSIGMPELLVIGIPLLTVVIFFYSPRYRMAALPIMVVLSTWLLFAGRARRPIASAPVWLSLGLVFPLLVQTDAATFRGVFLAKLGSLHGQVGDYPAAVESYRAAIGAGNLEAGPSLGHALRRMGNEEDGLKVLRKAASDLPDSAHAHRTFAVALAENNQLLKAEKSFLRAHELEPADWESPSGLGNVYQAMNRYEQAESWYRKSLQLNPSFATAWLNLGILLESARPKDAVEAFENALRLKPQLMPARLSLASLLATCREQTVRNGAAALRLLAPLGPALDQAPGLLEIRAAAHAANGDWDAAKKWQQLAIDKFAAKSQNPTDAGSADTLVKARAALAAYARQRTRLK